MQLELQGQLGLKSGMKTLFFLILLMLLGACSESTPESEVAEPGDEQPGIEQPGIEQLVGQKTEQSGDVLNQEKSPSTNEQSIESGVSEPEVSAQEMAKLEASMLSSTRVLAKKHKDQSEQASINELENLSEADRQALTDASAENTSKAAQEKAERQAAAAALQSIDEP